MDHEREWAPPETVEHEKQEFESNRNAMIGGRISDDEFRQFRLERGVYGQRQPGVQMVRFKIPYGGLNPRQLRRIADVSASFGHGIVHLTTRQDVQIHYVKLSDIPKIMELLADVDLTTREACGNTVRNVTACPFAGVCRDELFDVTAHAHRTAQHLMRNPSTAGMGRKFKISFSGCDSGCGLAAMHDIGLVARERDGQRGFMVLVGGGLGAAPKSAELLYEFIPESKLLPLAEAITRVFYLHGERDKRMRARMKFLVSDIGIDAFRKLVEAELRGLPNEVDIEPLADYRPVVAENNGQSEPVDPRWLATNVYRQKQEDYLAVTVRLPLGDILADSLTKLADLTANFTSDIRITVEQNLLLRWIEQSRLAELYAGLKSLGLVEAGAGRLIDATVCPGADTCNLGITSSKGLARAFTGELETTLKRFADLDIGIKISGCPNSCGQHHIADIGFYGCSMKIGGRVAPAFEMLLGGRVTGTQAEFAEPVTKFPSRRLPAVLGALLDAYDHWRSNGESFAEYVQAVGLEKIAEDLKSHGAVDPENPGDVFQDWGGHSNFALKVGRGECAGDDIDMVDALLGRAQSFLNDARQYHANSEFDHSTYCAYAAVIQSAKAYLIAHNVHATSYHQITSEFARLRGADPEWSAQFADFRSQLEAFKHAVPDAALSSEYIAFAESIVASVTDWSKVRSRVA